MKCLKHCTIKIKGHVRGVRGVKHCTVLPIKDQRLCMSEVLKVVFVAFTQQCIQSNLTHITQVGLVNYKGDCRQDAQPIPNS